MRLTSADKVYGRALRHRKRLIGKKRVDILRKLPCQSDREFGDVARQSAGGKSQRRGIESYAHLFMLGFGDQIGGAQQRFKGAGVGPPAVEK